jgi:hypothetical protein
MSNKPAPALTPLIVKHFYDLSFELRLRHKVTGKYIGNNAYVDNAHEALFFEAGPFGMSNFELHCFLIQDAGQNWLHQTAAGEFDVESSLGEM